jgi:hypothetical protein
MDDDPGGRDRSHEPPPLAPVRQLRLGDFEGSTAAGEEWYETERLSGQITGGAASEPPVDRQAPGHDQPVLLDWRHAQGTRAPTALQRLGERLDRRLRQREPRASRSDARQPPWGRRARRAAFAGASEARAPTLRAPERPAAAEQNRIRFADDPRTDTREPHERMRSRASRSTQAAVGVDWRRGDDRYRGVGWCSRVAAGQHPSQRAAGQHPSQPAAGQSAGCHEARRRAEHGRDNDDRRFGRRRESRPPASRLRSRSYFPRKDTGNS